MERTLSSYTYDSGGRVETISERGNVVTKYYYPDPNTVRVVSYDGEVETLQKLDALGRVKSLEQTTADGYFKTGNTYDKAGRFISRKVKRDNLSGEEIYAYDSEGRLLSYTGLRGYDFGFEYNGLGRLLTETGPEGMLNSYDYDNQGNLVSQTDATGEGTILVYDDLNRLRDIQYPDNSKESMEYDARGRIIQITNRQGAVTEIQYNAARRQRIITNHNGATVTETYNAAGQIINLMDAAGAETKYSYDDATGALETTTYADGQQQTLHWSELALLDSIEEISADTSVEPRVTRFIYAQDNYYRLTEVVKPGNLRYGYEYDYAGRLRKLTQIGVNGRENILRNYEYRSDGSLESEWYVQEGQTYEKHYATDLAGLVNSITNFRGMETGFAYDGLGRQTKVDYGTDGEYNLTYAWISGGSTMSVTGPGSYNNVYSFDSSGQLLSDTNNTSGETWTYQYAAGLLTQSDGPTNHDRINYDYDTDGNRIREYFTDQAIYSAGVETQVVSNTNLYVPGNNGKGNGHSQGMAGAAGSPYAQKEWSNYSYRADNRMIGYQYSQGEVWE